MDRAAIGNRRRTGSVKAANNLYGERILEGIPSVRKPQMDFLEKSTSRATELHVARWEIGRYEESKTASESERAQAEYELSKAKKTVKELSLLIEKSNSKAKTLVRDIKALNKQRRREERTSVVRNIESNQHAEVMAELEVVKQELSKLKLDMAYVLEEKSRMEKEVKSSSLKMLRYSDSAQALRKEIEEANEEQVLVELARIEALKEFGEIETQREKEASDFSAAMEKTKQKMTDIVEEIDQSKELESKLAATLSDVDVLQNELKVVKEMDKKVQRNDSLKRASFRGGEEMGALPSLQSILEELEAAKKELASVREEGFQCMASMDVIRKELKHVKEEMVRWKSTQKKADLTVQNLNSKLLRAKSKLEAVSAAEEKANSILSSLALTVEQLKTEAEAAQKEKDRITSETATVKANTLKTESEIDLTEERLQVAMQELEVAKSSEASALENLKTFTENAMKARASTSQHSSKITISKFEYEYLTARAGGAEEIADKKVAAAHAWIEALKASDKEILMRTELAQREIREMSMKEERDAYRAHKSLSGKRMMEGGFHNRRQKREKNTENAEAEHLQRALPRNSAKGNGNVTPSRRAKFRKSASPAARKSASPAARHINSFTIKKKTKVIPNLAKFFIGKRNEKDL
ncbi:Protein PLASTID MOVEMENT IMPAIRED 2 [Morella rubra]|uniref:Protein PLASTID MOVEMENT IMPAIRED 2 n=1 Tax=Morella rubra TaxID=262757 RepID=A0A6A1VEV7_9ROSI|nr:Protein PLASTID MOVEMENT IMPAIRED 2 [Morella rubra]